MDDLKWQRQPEENAEEEEPIIEMLKIFDVEKEILPPFFFETVLLSENIEEMVARHEEKAFKERILRRFFQDIGLDYDAWCRQRRQRERRHRAGGVALLLLVAIGVLFLVQPQILEAIRRPLVRRFADPPTPITSQRVEHYHRVAEIQDHFSICLPQQPPAGFRLVSVNLELGYPAGPRATISYQRGDPGDPTEGGDVLGLFVWSLIDEEFPILAGVLHEPIEIAGQPALWVEGTSGGRDGQLWRREGGWVLWEQEPYKLALISGSLSRQELVGIAEELVEQCR